MAHEHSVYDSDKHFRIDPVTRQIKNNTGKVVLMQHDHNSERFTFELPKVVEGHDMSKCNQVQIHYQNKEAETGTDFDDVYEVDDLQSKNIINQQGDKEDVVVFSWLISGNATQYVGPLNFSIRFACVADDGTIEYAWNTAAHCGVMISSCFYNSEAVVSTFSDVLEKWYNDLYLASIGDGVSISEVRNMLGAVAIDAKAVPLPAANWVDGAQTVTVDGVTANEDKCHVFATYHIGSYEQWRDSYIRVSAQGDGTLTFTCDSDVVPNADVVINIAIYYSE